MSGATKKREINMWTERLLRASRRAIDSVSVTSPVILTVQIEAAGKFWSLIGFRRNNSPTFKEARRSIIASLADMHDMEFWRDHRAMASDQS